MVNENEDGISIGKTEADEAQEAESASAGKQKKPSSTDNAHKGKSKRKPGRPKTDTVSIKVALPRPVHDALIPLAEEMGITINQYITLIAETISLDPLLCIFEDDPATARKVAMKAISDFLDAKTVFFRDDPEVMAGSGPEPEPEPEPEPDPKEQAVEAIEGLQKMLGELATTLTGGLASVKKEEGEESEPRPVARTGRRATPAKPGAR